MIHKNQNIDILPLLFMPFTGEKKLSHNFCFIYLEIANFTDFFWVKHTFKQHSVSKKRKRLLIILKDHKFFVILRIWDSLQKYNLTLFFSLFSCIHPDLCDDNRNKLSLNPFGAFAAESFAASEDVLNGLISSAQNAKCPDEGDVCCSKEFTKEVSVDCVISPWSSCSQSCGPGTQNRNISVPAKNGGEECTGNLDRACNEKNCPGKRLLSQSAYRTTNFTNYEF